MGSTYRDQKAENDQPHNEEDKVGREGQKRIEEGGDENDGEYGADGRGDDAIDNPAILRRPSIRDPVQERREDPKHDDRADELPDAQADQGDF